MRTIDTPYGPLTLTWYAGPTTAPGHGYLNDGKYPSAAHAAGREPDTRYVGCRVRNTNEDAAPLTINGVRYFADATFALDPAKGWHQEFGIYHALTRAGGSFMDGQPTDGARKAWAARILPAILAALTADTIAAEAAEAAAREAFIADCRKVAASLRAEADRLDTLTED